MTPRQAVIQLLETNRKKYLPEYQPAIDEVLADLNKMSDEDYAELIRRFKNASFSSREEYSTGIDGYSIAGAGSGGKPSILS